MHPGIAFSLAGEQSCGKVGSNLHSKFVRACSSSKPHKAQSNSSRENKQHPLRKQLLLTGRISSASFQFFLTEDANIESSTFAKNGSEHI